MNLEDLATADYARALEERITNLDRINWRLQHNLDESNGLLGGLLARITLGECLICGTVPTQDHDAECPVPKALEHWDRLQETA